MMKDTRSDEIPRTLDIPEKEVNAMIQAKNGSRLIFMTMILALMGISVLAEASRITPKDYSKIIEAPARKRSSGLLRYGGR